MGFLLVFGGYGGFSAIYAHGAFRICLAFVAFTIFFYDVESGIQNILKRQHWIYGTCNEVSARRHTRNGNVQFILWKKGESGHYADFWHDMEKSHWDGFKPY